jgi:hypothetical protein
MLVGGNALKCSHVERCSVNAVEKSWGFHESTKGVMAAAGFSMVAGLTGDGGVEGHVETVEAKENRDGERERVDTEMESMLFCLLVLMGSQGLTVQVADADS